MGTTFYLLLTKNEVKAENNSLQLEYNNFKREALIKEEILENHVANGEAELNKSKKTQEEAEMNIKGLEERLESALEQIKYLTTPVDSKEDGTINEEVIYEDVPEDELDQAYSEVGNNGPEIFVPTEEYQLTTIPCDKDEQDINIGVESWLYADAPRDVKKSISIKSYQETFGVRPQWVLRFSKEFLESYPNIKKFVDDPESVMVRQKRDGTVIVAGMDT